MSIITVGLILFKKVIEKTTVSSERFMHKQKYPMALLKSKYLKILDLN